MNCTKLSLKISISNLWKLLFLISTTVLTFNTLFLPFDKLVLPIYILLLIATEQWVISKNRFIVFLLLLLYVSFISLINYGTNDFLIYYPPLFVIAAFLASSNQYITLKTIQYALLVNIIAGIVFLFAHYLGVENSYTNDLLEKGIPFLVTTKGFSPTVQVYGTCCILWLIIAYEEKCANRWLILFVILALLITLNRVSIAFLLLLLFYYKRRTFYCMILIGGMISIIYFEELKSVFFDTGTLNSRIGLRRGAELSYWQSNDVIVWLFGRANHHTSEFIASKTLWERTYIENGIDFIFHSYGACGMVIYLMLIASFLIFLLLRKQYKYTAFVVYYFAFLQYMTNEFLASTLFFFVLTIMMLSNEASKIRS